MGDDAVALSALIAPLLPTEVRYRDDVRAGLIWLVEALKPKTKG